MAGLKAAIITDIHYGRDVAAKLGTKAPRLLEAFVKAANNYRGRGVDIVVDMGDRITAYQDDDPETVKDNMRTVCTYFNRLAAPVCSINGNHDINYLSRAENAAITGSPAESYSRDAGGWHLVFFNPSGDKGTGGALNVTAEDLEWLRQDLAATDRRTIVFSHVPLDNVAEGRAIAESEKLYDDTGQEVSPKNAQYRNMIAGRFGYPEQGAAIRKIMEDSGKVALCMSGHIHGNRRRDLNGVAYITQQALTHEHRKFYRVASGTYSLLEADDERIVIHLKGKVRKDYVIDLPPVTSVSERGNEKGNNEGSGKTWLPPVPPPDALSPGPPAP